MSALKSKHSRKNGPQSDVRSRVLPPRSLIHSYARFGGPFQRRRWRWWWYTSVEFGWPVSENRATQPAQVVIYAKQTQRERDIEKCENDAENVISSTLMGKNEKNSQSFFRGLFVEKVLLLASESNLDSHVFLRTGGKKSLACSEKN